MGKHRRKERRANKAQKRADRRARKADRRDAKFARKQMRQQERTNRSNSRNKTKQTAYQHGMDPNKWIGDAADVVGDAVGSFARGRGVDLNQAGNNILGNNDSDGGKGKGNFILYAIIGVVAFLFLGKKK